MISCTTISGASAFSLIITIYVRMVRPQKEVILLRQRETHEEYDEVVGSRAKEVKIIDVKVELNYGILFSTKPLH
jgi:hypothetical protein